MSPAGSDVEFMNSVREAAHAFRRLSKRLSIAAATGETKRLIGFLKSDYPLGAVEREAIADLLAGEFGRPVGRPVRKAMERDKRRKAYARYGELMAQFREEGRAMPRQPLAVTRVASEFRLTPDQVRALIKDRKMRI